MPVMSEPQVDSAVLKGMIANTGQSVYDLSQEKPVLLIFLRHFGCTFCREALSDIAAKRDRIESQNAQLAFVHMTDKSIAERYFNRYNLVGIPHIEDPQCRFYEAFGLVKGSFTQLFGLQSWIRGFSAGVVQGHGIGPQLGDGFQMPGVFVIQDGKIKDSFIHRLASDRPDYVDLARCCQLQD